jgi:hypothetical protein
MTFIKYILIYSFFLLVFGYGVFISVGTMRNLRSWKNHYKRIDLEKYFGDFGRVLWVIVGLVYIAISIYMLMKLTGIGPLEKLTIR